MSNKKAGFFSSLVKEPLRKGVAELKKDNPLKRSTWKRWGSRTTEPARKLKRQRRRPPSAPSNQ